MKVKKSKATKKKLEETQKTLKNLNQKLLDQITDLKDEKLEHQNTKNKVDESETEKLLRRRNHIQSLLTQIKKL